MRNTFLLAAAIAALTIIPGVAMSDDSGATAGAVSGAVGGAVVGGPVGAVVGAGAGAVVGGAVTGPNRDRVIVDRRTTGGVGCKSTTVRKENEFGDSKTVRKEEC